MTRSAGGDGLQVYEDGADRGEASAEARAAVRQQAEALAEALGGVPLYTWADQIAPPPPLGARHPASAGLRAARAFSQSWATGSRAGCSCHLARASCRHRALRAAVAARAATDDAGEPRRADGAAWGPGLALDEVHGAAPFVWREGDVSCPPRLPQLLDTQDRRPALGGSMRSGCSLYCRCLRRGAAPCVQRLTTAAAGDRSGTVCSPVGRAAVESPSHTCEGRGR
jgi:hypothetical protein